MYLIHVGRKVGGELNSRFSPKRKLDVSSLDI